MEKGLPTAVELRARLFRNRTRESNLSKNFCIDLKIGFSVSQVRIITSN
jgi:hypothetical protein